MSRLPVIQAFAAEVRQTTQSLLSQLLQKLRSNIQVSCEYSLFLFQWSMVRLWNLGGSMFCWCYLFQLPECLRIIGYLRRIGVFGEYEMRLQVNCFDISCNHLNSSFHYICIPLSVVFWKLCLHFWMTLLVCAVLKMPWGMAHWNSWGPRPEKCLWVFKRHDKLS